MAAMFVISARLVRMRAQLLPVLCISIAMLSAFIVNAATVAVFIPIDVALAQSRRSPACSSRTTAARGIRQDRVTGRDRHGAAREACVGPTRGLLGPPWVPPEIMGIGPASKGMQPCSFQTCAYSWWYSNSSPPCRRFRRTCGESRHSASP